jgi:hypothetical protein
MRAVECVAFDQLRSATQPAEPEILWVSADRSLWRVTIVRPRFSRVIQKPSALPAEPRLGFMSGATKDQVWLQRGEGAFGLLDLRSLHLRTFTPKDRSTEGVIRRCRRHRRRDVKHFDLYRACRLDLDRLELTPVLGTRTSGAPAAAGTDQSGMPPQSAKDISILARYEPGPAGSLSGGSNSGSSAGGYITVLREDKAGGIRTRPVKASSGSIRLGRIPVYAASSDTAGIKTNVVRAVEEDSSGVIWVGTDWDSPLHS